MYEVRKKYFLYVCILLTTLPLIFAVPTPQGITPLSQAYISFFSSVTGYIGISLLIWQLILGTRAISGLFFDNLTDKIQLHKFLGKYGVLLIFLHPLLILMQYREKLWYLFTPNLSSEYERHVTFGRIAFGGLLIVWISSALLRSKIAYRPWKLLHYLSYPILVLALLHVPEIGSSYKEKLVSFYWFIFVGVTILCFILRARHLFSFGKVRYIIAGKNELVNGVWVLRLNPESQALDIQNGQYIYVQPRLYHEEHPFTVLDHSRKTGEIVIAFKVFGAFSKKLSKLNIGSAVYIDGPYGTFTRELTIQPNLSCVFIAGGIGITPFMKHIMSRSANTQRLIYANKSKTTAVFEEILQPYLLDHYSAVYSHGPAVNSWEFSGRISEHIIKKQVPNLNSQHFFICGPKAFMHHTSNLLKKLGVHKNNIHTEEFGF